MKLSKKIFFSLIPAVVLFGGLEVVLRATGFEYKPKERKLFRPTVAEFVGTVENYHQTVFDPPGYIWIRQDKIAGRDIGGGNSYAWPIQKDPDKVRVAFLGGSTSETGSDHPYPERCVKLLNSVAGSNRFDELNVACSSYSTHQSLIALRRYVLPRNPDVVVVYHGWNDAAVLDDRFADYTKDSLVQDSDGRENVSQPAVGVLAKLKITGLVGRTIDKARGTQARVPVPQFDENLREIVSICKERGVPVIVVVRPKSDALPHAEYNEDYITCYGPEFGSTKEGIYHGQWKLYTDVQRSMSKFDNVRLAKADEYLDEAQREIAQEDTDLTIFVRDACHNTGIGYQKIAECVAMAVAPELKEKIEAHIKTGAYWAGLAADSMQVEAIDEVVYAANKAKALDPLQAPVVDPLIAKAESLRGFYRLFDAGKWDGEARPSWPEQIKSLQKCLEMRPDDYGVILQMFRVCMYNGRPDAAAAPMMGFKPSTGTQQYQWLKLLFQSHASAQRWNQAEQIAQAVLKMNPQDQEMLGFLGQLNQARQRGQL